MPTKIGRTQYVTATEAAALCEMKRDTFRAYVSRGSAPAPAITGDGITPLYKLADVEKYRDNRPGQGRRTDLGGRSKK